MKGDFSRETFAKKKHYTGVLMQQGRVLLDADWNEQVSIRDYLDQTKSKDIIGKSGAPKSGGGFKIVQIVPKNFLLSQGRIYVDGILCEIEQDFTYLKQPDLPKPPAIEVPNNARIDLVYLDVWNRHITSLDDPSIREKALGGPDTTTRTKTVWQVKVLADIGKEDCNYRIIDKYPDSNCKLTVQVVKSEKKESACQMAAPGGYGGQENHLYRVEIHSASQNATFKWSKDNGSVVFKCSFVDNEPKKLAVSSLGMDPSLALHENDIVEVQDNERELKGEPGTMAKIVPGGIDQAKKEITLNVDVSKHNNKSISWVRRWDQGQKEIPVSSGPIILEDGIQIKFSGSVFHRGDYWTFAARTSTATSPPDIETFQNAERRGTYHHYCPLALIFWERDAQNNWRPRAQDCRPKMPSLVDLNAEDIQFDDGKCKLANAETVQDALDRLCQERDLRHHNKHLHGWGIVCGLRVSCGEDPERRKINIANGYAIDGQGADIILKDQTGQTTLDIFNMIDAYDKIKPKDPLLDEAGGDICLLMKNGVNGPTFELEKYDPSQRWHTKSWYDLLEGTLPREFLGHCIAPITTFLDNELKPKGDDVNNPASPVYQRLSALTNLIAQPVNPQSGQNIFISYGEHKILEKFYNGLRETLTHGGTFCSMFYDARPFPDYPFANLKMDTIFAVDNHERIRIRPGGKEAYTVGPGLNKLKPSTTINRFDLEKKVMLARIDPLAGDSVGKSTGGGAFGAVQDVAFSADGKMIYVIVPNSTGSITFFRKGEIVSKEQIRWSPAVAICGVKLLTLATTLKYPNSVFAVGTGKQSERSGLYMIDPNNVEPNMMPIGTPFDPFGHLKTTDQGFLFATVNCPSRPGFYDRLRAIELNGTQVRYQDFSVDLGREDEKDKIGSIGQDDIALNQMPEKNLIDVYCMVNAEIHGNAGIFTRKLNIYRSYVNKLISGNGLDWTGDVSTQQTSISLEYFAYAGKLLMTYKDGYCLRVGISESFLPLQIGPVAIASDVSSKEVCVLNSISNTISLIPGELLKGDYNFDFQKLADYRREVIMAFIDLLGGFLQYLKDCFCDRFLVECPDEDKKIYLACINIREINNKHQIFKICNFSKRHYVKSFPTVGYWLSLLPIMPLLNQLIGEFCCMILPDKLKKYSLPTMPILRDAEIAEMAKPRLAVDSLIQGVFMANKAIASGMLKFDNARIIGQQMSRNIFEWASNPIPRPPETFAQAERVRFDAVPSSSLLGQPEDLVKEQLVARDIEYEVKPYEPGMILNFANPLSVAEPGKKVTLYVKDGKVNHYSVANIAAPVKMVAKMDVAASDQKVKDLNDRIESLQTEIGQMNQKHNAALEEKDLAIANLSKNLADISAVMDDLGDRKTLKERIRRLDNI